LAKPQTSAAVSPWTTELSTASAESISIRGYDLASLIGSIPFPSACFLLYTGELPDAAAARVIDAVMVASLDHGAAPPSVLAARTAISGGATLPAAAAAGLLTFGEFHGAAVEDSMRMLTSVVDDASGPTDSDLVDAADRLVAAHRADRRRIPGFGHRQHKHRDPRIERLFQIAIDAGVAGRHVAAAGAVETSLSRALDRPMPINIDGGIAAVLCELGVPSDLGNAVFIASRIAGVLAHANEERRAMRPMRPIDPRNHTYAGPAERSLSGPER
jgi:citrate synthase